MKRPCLLALLCIFGQLPCFGQCPDPDLRSTGLWATKERPDPAANACAPSTIQTFETSTNNAALPTPPNSQPTASANQIKSALASPILGFVPGDPGEILVIRGTPSSATLMPPVWPPAETSRLLIPPHQAFILAETTTPAAVGVSTFQGANLFAPAVIAGVLPGADFVAFSPGGTSALLYRVATNRLQIITGLPSSPTLSRDVVVSGLLSQAQKVAVNDDASQVLCLTADGLLYGVSVQGTATLLYSGHGQGTVAFLPQRSTALLWDGGDQTLIQIQDPAGALSINVLATGLNLSPDALLEVSADSTVAVMADSTASSVMLVNLTTRAVVQIAVAQTASALKSLRIPNLFLLSAEAGQSARVLYLDGSVARSYGVARTVERRHIVPLSVPVVATTPAGNPTPGKPATSTVRSTPAVRPPPELRRAMATSGEKEQ